MTPTRLAVAAAVLLLLPVVAPGKSAARTAQYVQEDLEKLHAVNQTQIQMERRVDLDAASPEVKQLAATIAQQHRQEDEQLQQLAWQHGIDLQGVAYNVELLNEKNRADRALNGLTGEAFDSAYTNLVIQDHDEQLKKNLPAWIKDAQHAHERAVVSFLRKARGALAEHPQLARRPHEEQHQAVSSGAGNGGANSYHGPSRSARRPPEPHRAP